MPCQPCTRVRRCGAVGRLAFKAEGVVRRALVVKVSFEPSRLGREHLRDAYEQVVPVRQRVSAREQAREPRAKAVERVRRRTRGASA